MQSHTISRLCCDRLLLYSIMFSGCIHVVACISTSFPFIPQNVSLYGYVTFYLSFHPLSCFHFFFFFFLAIMNNTPIHTSSSIDFWKKTNPNKAVPYSNLVLWFYLISSLWFHLTYSSLLCISYKLRVGFKELMRFKVNVFGGELHGWSCVLCTAS